MTTLAEMLYEASFEKSHGRPMNDEERKAFNDRMQKRKDEYLATLSPEAKKSAEDLAKTAMDWLTRMAKAVTASEEKKESNAAKK